MSDDVQLFGYLYARNTACMVCEHFAAGAPLQLVVHDGEGEITFACGQPGHPDEEWKVIGLGRAADMLDLTSVPELQEGEIARRASADQPWNVQRLA